MNYKQNINKVKTTMIRGPKSIKYIKLIGQPTVLVILEYHSNFKRPYLAEYLPKMVPKGVIGKLRKSPFHQNVTEYSCWIHKLSTHVLTLDSS